MVMLLFFNLYCATVEIMPMEKVVVMPFYYDEYRLGIDNDNIKFIHKSKSDLQNSGLGFVLFSDRLIYYLFLDHKPICIAPDLKLEYCKGNVTEWLVKKVLNGHTICSERFMKIDERIYETVYCLTLQIRKNKDGEDDLMAIVDEPRIHADNQIFKIRSTKNTNLIE